MSDGHTQTMETGKKVRLSKKFLKDLQEELLVARPRDVKRVPVREDLEGIRAMILPYYNAA